MKIEFLEDHRHLFPVLEDAFKAEWKDYYGPGGQGNALSDIHSLCHKDKLPICLVALKQGTFMGSVALRKKSASHHHLSPWLTSLFVIPKERRKGIGTKLIEAAESLSAELGFSKVYSRSATATGFFRKNHWIPMDRLDALILFSKELEPGQFLIRT